MSKAKDYDEASVLRVLQRKNGVYVDSRDKSITVSSGSNDIGNGSWGKIDYLVKVHKYVVLHESSKGFNSNGNHSNKTRKAKRVNAEAPAKPKFNMATMTRSAMQGVAKKHY